MTQYFSPSQVVLSQIEKVFQRTSSGFLLEKNISAKNPINLLFSSDQFLSEFASKYPQRKKISAYKLQLKEQKKLRLFYGNLSRLHIKKYLLVSEKMAGERSKNFFKILERRLDVILFRACFAKTIPFAKQLITHQKIFVNNQCITRPGYLVKPGDIIAIESQTRLYLAREVKKILHHNLESSPKKLQEWNPILKRDFRNFQKKFLSKKQVAVLSLFLSKKLVASSQAKGNFLKEDNQSQNSLVLKTFSNFSLTPLEQTIFFTHIKKTLLKKFPTHSFVSHFPTFGMKPIHLECSYKIFQIIFLYPPQRLSYPFLCTFDAFSS